MTRRIKKREDKGCAKDDDATSQRVEGAVQLKWRVAERCMRAAVTECSRKSRGVSFAERDLTRSALSFSPHLSSLDYQPTARRMLGFLFPKKTLML